jgi:kynurenine formamidase
VSATTPASTTEALPLLGAELLARDAEVIDLTRPIYEGMPQWFGHQKTFIMRNQTHDEFKEIWKTSCGFEAHNLLISEHCGTHTDAVFEYDESGPHLDESPLAYWYGPGLCLDLAPASADQWITDEMLRDSLERSGLSINRGDVCLLHTGYGDTVFPTLKYAEEYPGLTREAAEFLAQAGVVNIGTDNLSIDKSTDLEFSAHQVCKKYGIVNTESLTNLDKVAGTRFYYLGLPLNIRAGTGSPIRAVALRGNIS